MERVTLNIKGMHCDHCVGRVTKALERLDGVEVVAVKIGSAKVAYDPARQSLEDLAQAVTDVGYSARTA